MLDITSTHGGLLNFGTIKSFGVANIQLENDFSNKGGTIDTDKDLTLIAGGALINDEASKIISEGEIFLGGDRKITNKGFIEATKSISVITNGILENSGDILSEYGSIKIDGKSIENFGKINAKKSITLLARKEIENIDSGLIKSGSNITITSVEGYIKNINSDPDRFSESGIIAAGKTVINGNLGFENSRAHIESAGSLEILTKGSFLNDSGNIISSDLMTLKVDGDVQNFSGGALQGLKGFTVRSYDALSTAQSFLNKGIITSGLAEEDAPTILEKVDILTKEAIENSGIIQATNDVVLESTEDEIQNNHTILTKLGKITATSKGSIINTGAITASKDLSLVSLDGAIANSGIILSDDGTIDLTAKTEIAHTSGTIKTSGDITLNAQTQGLTINGDIIATDSKLTINAFDDIISTGILQAKDNVVITATDGIFYNNAGNVLAGDGTLDITALSIKNDSTDPKNGYLQGNRLNLIATSGDIENIGVIYSKVGGALKAKSNIVNNQNIELGDGSTITATDQDVINTGLILSTKALTISAADKISNSGDINVPELILKTAQLFENKSSGAGVAASTGVMMENIKSINNSGIIDFGTMTATTGISSVINSGTLKGGALSITAPTFDNTGRTELSGGARLKVTSFTSNILTAAGISDITINGNYTNTRKLDINNSDLTITADSITNKSGGLIKARSFRANARNGGTFTNEGIIFGKTGLTVSSPTITNASSAYLVSGGILGLTGGKVTNHGGISSAQNMTINGTLENRGNIRTQGALDIRGTVANYGSLAGSNKIGITGNLTNSNVIVSNTNVTVTGGSSLYNSGTMTSYGSMSLNNSALTNTNVIQAVGSLSSSQSGNIHNSSSIYGGTINLRSTGGSIVNNARIIAKNNLSLQASGDIVNKNQISLTGYGTLALTAGGNIRNDREYQITKIDTDNFQLHTPVEPSTETTGEEVNRGSYHDQVLESVITTKTTYRDSEIIINPKKTIISSGGNITLSARNLNNTTGNISARNNISINGNELINSDIVRQEHVHNQREIRQYIKQRKWDWKGRGSWTTWGPYFRAGIDDVDTTELSKEPSLIQAGGTISGSLAGQVSLGSTESGGGKSGIYGPSGGGVGGAGNYSQVANEPQSPNSSGVSYKQNKDAAGARAFEISSSKTSKFTPTEIKSRQSLPAFTPALADSKSP